MIFVNIKDPLDREVSLPEDAWKHIQKGTLNYRHGHPLV